MKKFITMGLACATALAFASCMCPKCGGMGVEYAQAPGTHPYTGQKFRAGDAIPCLKCGGKGHDTGGAGAARYSQQGLFKIQGL